MTDEQQKEQFNKAYVHAVASVAHFQISQPSVDCNCIDLHISSDGEHQTQEDTMIAVQLKATEQNFLHDNGVHFPLEIKHYDNLRKTDIYIPRILVVMLVPADLNDWMSHSPDELVLRKCCYWVCLSGRASTSHTSKVTVVLPSANVFTPEALIEIMKKASNNLPLV